MKLSLMLLVLFLVNYGDVAIYVNKKKLFFFQKCLSFLTATFLLYYTVLSLINYISMWNFFQLYYHSSLMQIFRVHPLLQHFIVGAGLETFRY